MAKQTFTTGSVLTATQMNNLQANDYNWTVSQKTASYVLVAADAGTRIEMNSGSPTTVTVNTGLFTAGDTLFIQNIGAGATTITAGTATVNKATAGSLTLAQYQGGTLYFVSASSAVFFADAGYTPPLTTKGDLFGYDTAAARIPIGSNNQVLTADSTQALGLKWATPATGGMTLLSSTSISSTSTTISDISQSYKNLYIEVINPISTSSTALSFKWGVANAIQSNSYFWYGFLMPMNAGATVVNKSTATGYFDLTNGDTITAGNASKNLCTFFIPSYTVGSFHPVQVYGSLYHNATTYQSSYLAAQAQQQGAINCFRVDFGAGTCTGTINVYGVS